MSNLRQKVYLSYHHEDQDEVDDFMNTYDKKRNVFIARGPGVEMESDIIDSDDADYVIRRIRELYLKDSTVTVVLMGQCTWARRYVDWEIQSSLYQGKTVTPNGLLGIKLPSFKQTTGYPNRLNLNLKSSDKPEQVNCYARVMDYPTRKDTLAIQIEVAFQIRSKRATLIVNPTNRLANPTTPLSALGAIYSRLCLT